MNDDYTYFEYTKESLHPKGLPGEFYFVESEDYSALDIQVGGDHYKKYVIQPAEYNIKNNIPWVEGECIAKLTRWRDKGGIQDLRKVIHAIEILIELEEERIGNVK